MVTYGNMHRGVFLKRPNRFLALVDLAGRVERCHVPNTGRLGELLVPGTEVWCQFHPAPERKTAWSLVTVNRGGKLVNIDSQAPNRLAQDWLEKGSLGPVEDVRREQRFGEARFDLRFTREGKPWFLEVKGVTLESGGVARFPDAPTARGTKHLQCLQAALARGYGAAVLFLVQLSGVTRLEPNWAADPAFARELLRAAEAGVAVRAAACRVRVDGISVAGTVPVSLVAP